MLKSQFCFKSLLATVCLFIFSFPFHADQLILDHNLSPTASSTNLIFLDNRLIELQNQYKDDKHNSFIKSGTSGYFDSNHYYLNGPYYFSESFGRRFLKASLRAAEIGFIWGPLSYATVVVQHEVFGHGYRVRDLGTKKAELNHYKIDFKWTLFGPRLKEAYTKFSCDPETFNYSDELLVSIGGMEANSILARNLTMSWLSKGQIDGRQAVLWTYASLDQFGYILSCLNLKDVKPDVADGHDVLNYLATLNYIYPYGGPDRLQITNLAYKATLGLLLNPFLYLSNYSTYSYILFNSAVSIPSITIDKYHFLPSYRLGLTPFGPEDVIEVFYWTEGFSPMCIYWRSGEFSLNEYFGSGMECQRALLTPFGDFGLKLDVWYQPHMLNRISYYQGPQKHTYFGYEYYTDDHYKGYTHQELFGRHFGGAFSIFFQRAIQNDPNKNLWLQLGYKTKGFLAGESYKQAPIVKIGMQTQF